MDMHKKVFVAEITWLTKEQGGRTGGIPMKAPKYAPLIAIDGKNVFNGSSWSVICYSFERAETNKTKAFIRFLNAEKAPDILRQGVLFELFEGARKVADGKVTGETVYDFESDWF